MCLALYLHEACQCLNEVILVGSDCTFKNGEDGCWDSFRWRSRNVPLVHLIREGPWDRWRATSRSRHEINTEIRGKAESFYVRKGYYVCPEYKMRDFFNHARERTNTSPHGTIYQAYA